jgi:uncharacterized protein with PIN domain
MQQLAQFSFFGNLNDFLSKKDKHNRITYSFKATTAVKDAVEAIGVPHVEVEWLLINGLPAQFYTPLLPGDAVEVYPQDTPPAHHPLPPLRDKQKAPHCLVLDTHLGALARRLRLLGIDTYHDPTYTDGEVARISHEEHRIVLTRDIGLLKQKIIEWGYWLRSQQPEEQLLEVLNRYNLTPFFQPFQRCLSCNGYIQPVEKETVREALPAGTQEYFHDFYQCGACGKVYWKGSHYERMVQFIEKLKKKL